MTDLPPEGAPAGAGAAPDTEDQGPALRVLGQYVKDASFENPGAPQTLRTGQGQPQIQLGVDIGVQRIDQGVDEVALRIRAEATRNNETVFIAELLYAGLFAFANMPDNERSVVALIECPRLLFPFARQIIADMTRDGGFPPVMLEPIDFAGLYRQRMAQQQAAADSAEPGADAPAENGGGGGSPGAA